MMKLCPVVMRTPQIEGEDNDDRWMLNDTTSVYQCVHLCNVGPLVACSCLSVPNAHVDNERLGYTIFSEGYRYVYRIKEHGMQIGCVTGYQVIRVIRKTYPFE